MHGGFECGSGKFGTGSRAQAIMDNSKKSPPDAGKTDGFEFEHVEK